MNCLEIHQIDKINTNNSFKFITNTSEKMNFSIGNLLVSNIIRV